jgi:hypothetical protein
MMQRKLSIERWSTVTPETFVRFAGIASVIAYLRRCVRTVKIDRWRKAKREQLALAALETNPLYLNHLGEQEILDHILNQQCAKHIYDRLKDRQECLVIRLNLELGLAPKEIARRHPEEFSTPRDVYKVRDRVIRRLSQDPVLCGLWQPASKSRTGDRLSE